MSFKPSSPPLQSGKCADVREIEPSLTGTGLRVGIAMARFNRDVGEGLLSGCCQELRRLGVAPASVTLPPPPELSVICTLSNVAVAVCVLSEAVTARPK